MNKIIFFKVIEEGFISSLNWAQSNDFNDANAKKHPVFGEVAKLQGEAPFKAVYSFKDGNVVGLRGDKFMFPTYLEMLRNLHKQTLKYFIENKIQEVKIFDNRRLLLEDKRMILHWNKNTGTQTNLLPLYSGEFDLSKTRYRK